MKIYPNPTDGEVRIELNKTHRKISLKVYNSIGECVDVREFKNQQKMEYYLDGNPGLYLLKLQTSEGFKKTIKLIKEK